MRDYLSWVVIPDRRSETEAHVSAGPTVIGTNSEEVKGSEYGNARRNGSQHMSGGNVDVRIHTGIPFVDVSMEC